MQLRFDPVADAVFVYLVDRIGSGEVRSTQPAAIELDGAAINVDVDGDGKVLGIEILGASRVLRRETLNAARELAAELQLCSPLITY